MAYDKTAGDEIHRRIKDLDREESRISHRIGNLQAELGRAEADREALACKRRQYEYALATLDGDDVTRVSIKVTGAQPTSIPVNAR